MGAGRADQERKAEATSVKPAKAAEFGWRSVCIVRYGRATVTIRRWGGWRELAADSELTRALHAFREEGAGAVDVASALVRARVANHSPTFCWEEADPDRLLRMVVACSTEPQFDSADPEIVARQLIATQDSQREQARALSDHVAESLQPALAVMRRSAESIASLGRVTISPGSAELSKALSELARPIAGDWMAKWSAAMPRLVFEPSSNTALFDAMAAPSRAALRAATIELKRFPMPDLSAALRGIATAYPTVQVPAALQRSARKKRLSLGEALSAARFASVFIDGHGDADGAGLLADATSEAEEVIDSPTLEKLQESIDRLSDRLITFEERRDTDHRADWNNELILWAIGVYIAIYLALVPYFIRP